MSSRENSPGAERRQVFVAYSYRLYEGTEYRRVFHELGEKESVQFLFADARISNEQLLDKVTGMIRESDFSLFDISDWNPNVTLELGIARGGGYPWYILIDPSKSTGPILEAPADLRGLDRVEYRTFEQLAQGLQRLLRQPIPIQPKSDRNSIDSIVTIYDDLLPVEARKHSPLRFDARKGDTLSVLAREVDGHLFDLYLMDRRNYVEFNRTREEHDLLAAEDESIYDLKKRIPRDGEWYLVLDAYRKTDERNVHLTVRLTRSETQAA